MLYAYVSSTGNNGSAFGGLNANTMWYNTSTAAAQLLGRFFMIIPIMAIAGNLAKKENRPRIRRNVSSHRGTVRGFAGLHNRNRRRADIFPGLSLGPILEHLLMNAGKVF